MSEDRIKKSIFSKLKENKKLQYIIVFSVAALLIFIFVIGFLNEKKTDEKAETSFVEELEKRLSDAIGKISGVGKNSVVITVESGMETVLATKTTVTETSGGRETVETPILVNGKTVVLKEKYPKIIGVLIVAEGADNILTYRKIQQAAVGLLDISVNQIEILSM